MFVKEFVLHKLSQLHKMCGDGGKQLIIFIYLLNNGIVALYPDCPSPSYGALFNGYDLSGSQFLVYFQIFV